MVYLRVQLDSVSFRASPALKRAEKFFNRQRFLVLRSTACVILAGASESSVVHDSARSGRKALHAIPAVCSQVFVGSGRSGIFCSLPSVGSERPRVVAQLRAAGTRYLPRSGVLTARLMVRHLGCGLGSSFGRRRGFRFLVPGRLRDVYQRKGALAIERALTFFAPRLQISSMAVFAGISIAIAYLRNQGGGGASGLPC